MRPPPTGLLVLFAGACCRAPAEVRGNHDPHSPHDVAQYIAQLESPKRVRSHHLDEVVGALHLQDGMTVADLGCGPGLLSVMFGQALPHGLVYAVDVEPAQLERLNQRLTEARLERVVPVLAVPDDPRLPPGSLDLLFVLDTYHHFDDRPHYLAKLKALLKPGGRVAVIDYHKRELPVGPPPAHKIARETVLEEMQQAGFRLVEEPAFLPYQYFLIFASAEG